MPTGTFSKCLQRTRLKDRGRGCWWKTASAMKRPSDMKGRNFSCSVCGLPASPQSTGLGMSVWSGAIASSDVPRTSSARSASERPTESNQSRVRPPTSKPVSPSKTIEILGARSSDTGRLNSADHVSSSSFSRWMRKRICPGSTAWPPACTRSDCCRATMRAFCFSPSAPPAASRSGAAPWSMPLSVWARPGLSAWERPNPCSSSARKGCAKASCSVSSMRFCAFHCSRRMLAAMKSTRMRPQSMRATASHSSTLSFGGSWWKMLWTKVSQGSARKSQKPTAGSAVA
mmetsp:Transcript_13763/g.39324  ORF Transcript_13763/g.39324 Transcript_13763/m.39324 type:complete len:287 (-) Transcript_13763:945-1805(-)